MVSRVSGSRRWSQWHLVGEIQPSASNLAKWRSFANSFRAHFSGIPTFQVDAWMYLVITYIPVIPREAEDQICEFVNAFTTHIRF